MNSLHCFLIIPHFLCPKGSFFASHFHKFTLHLTLGGGGVSFNLGGQPQSESIGLPSSENHTSDKIDDYEAEILILLISIIVSLVFSLCLLSRVSSAGPFRKTSIQLTLVNMRVAASSIRSRATSASCAALRSASPWAWPWTVSC